MTTLFMSKFGRTLTDRTYGKSVADTILKENSFPVLLDFTGVISLGSSFGDELLAAIAPKQERRVTVKSANGAIRSCLEKVAEDIKVQVDFAQ